MLIRLIGFIHDPLRPSASSAVRSESDLICVYLQLPVSAGSIVAS